MNDYVGEARLRDIHEALHAGHFEWAIEALKQFKEWERGNSLPRNPNLSERMRLINDCINHRYVYSVFHQPTIGYDGVKADNAAWRARHRVESSLVPLVFAENF